VKSSQNVVAKIGQLLLIELHSVKFTLIDCLGGHGLALSPRPRPLLQLFEIIHIERESRLRSGQAYKDATF